MVLVGANPAPASSSANDTNAAAHDVGDQTGAAESATQTAKDGGGELTAFTGKCDDLLENLLAALQAAEATGVDTGDGIGESAVDSVATDAEMSAEYASVPPINGQEPI
ncbi:MAG TPA: hypothetical protein H9881_17425 [Candidatus Stackebrandtia excrementipullorum]|nr:hypothetical protein [Candidatus Stackebrandtia excrementipullorum]